MRISNLKNEFNQKLRKKNYDKSELIGRKVVVFCNLAQRELRGIKSEGMILAAVDGEEVCLLEPDKDIKNGAKIE